MGIYFCPIKMKAKEKQAEPSGGTKQRADFTTDIVLSTCVHTSRLSLKVTSVYSFRIYGGHGAMINTFL